jgi:uncharacterized membrane protein YfcA
MIGAKEALFAVLGIWSGLYLVFWIVLARRTPGIGHDENGKSKNERAPNVVDLTIGFVTNFFDALGIGSFATTTAVFKLRQMVPDRLIPGTLNAGHAFPVISQAFIFMAIVRVDIKTLVLMIVASVLGAWLGAGVVAAWPKRKVQIGMGLALLAAASLMLMTQLKLFPRGGNTLNLEQIRLVVGIGGNFVLGALMTLGIGLYAPCMILVSLLGMNPKAAFPIMMGSCAFLMPVGSLRFIRKGSYSLRHAVGLALGGVPGVLLAAFVVKSLPISAIRWLVVIVVVYTATMMLRSALGQASGMIVSEKTE